MLRVERPTMPPSPVVFDSPHSGSDYPADFRPAIGLAVLRRAEDAHVDKLFAHVKEQGAPLLHALFPRSYIDANRAIDDLDTDMVAGAWPYPARPGAKSRNGKGLIWRTVQREGEIYDRKLTIAEIEQRIATCWQPYHDALIALLDDVYRRHGRVLHINCHSMRSYGHTRDPDGPVPRPDFLLADRDGTSCAPEITRFAAQTLHRMGFTVAINDPYKGMELVRAYADPAAGRHSLMIEIKRGLYMDETSLAPTAAMAELQRRLTDFTAAMIARFSDMG